MTQKILIDEKDRHWLERYQWKWSTHGWTVSTRETTLFLHRELLGLRRDMTRIVVFINGDRSDCRRSNLRIISMGQFVRSQNPNSRGYSVKKGRSKPYEARISHDGKRYFLGSYDNAKEASDAYQEAVWRIEHGLPPKNYP
jgi:hypothetical protein